MKLYLCHTDGNARERFFPLRVWNNNYCMQINQEKNKVLYDNKEADKIVNRASIVKVSNY